MNKRTLSLIRLTNLFHVYLSNVTFAWGWGLLEGGYYWNSAPIDSLTRGGNGCLLERRTLNRNYVIDLLSLLQLPILTYLSGACSSLLFSGMDDVLPNRSPYIPKIMKVT